VTSADLVRLTSKTPTIQGRESVFEDVDSIAPGDDLEDRIIAAVAERDVLLALIGDRQAESDDPDDEG
jgi:hypothetical protein